MTICKRNSDITEDPAIKNKKNKFKALNNLMAGVIFCSMILYIANPFFSYIAPVLLFFNHVVLPLLFEHHISTGKSKKALVIVRSAVIVLFASLYVVPIICIGFNNTKLLYSTKKRIFSSEKCSDFPDKLPENCNDYIFRTEPQALAQDYRPCAFLAFHSDTDTMKQMENDISAKGGVVSDYSLSLEEFVEERFSYKSEIEKEQIGTPEKYMYSYLEQKGLPIYVHSWLERNTLNIDMENAVIYKNKGCLFNYETGLVVFWT